jgi:hypothetical protein
MFLPSRFRSGLGRAEGPAGQDRHGFLCVVLGCDVDVVGVTGGGEFLAGGAAVEDIGDVLVSPGGPGGCCFGRERVGEAEGGDDGAGAEEVFEGGPQFSGRPSFTGGDDSRGPVRVAEAVPGEPSGDCCGIAEAAGEDMAGGGRGGDGRPVG